MTDDLNELERLLKEATPIPWLQFGGTVRDSSISRVLICSGVHCKIDVANRDHTLIAAAVNALPGMIRRIRELEGKVELYKAVAQARRAEIAELYKKCRELEKECTK